MVERLYVRPAHAGATSGSQGDGQRHRLHRFVPRVLHEVFRGGRYCRGGGEGRREKTQDPREDDLLRQLLLEHGLLRNLLWREEEIGQDRF